RLAATGAVLAAALATPALAGSAAHDDAARLDAAVHEARAAVAHDASGAELERLRTQASRTRVIGDGRYRTTISGSPLNFRDDDGGWRTIDSRLVPTADGAGWRNAANAFSVTLPRRIASGPLDGPSMLTAFDGVAFQYDDASVAFALEGAQGVAEVADASATFRDALP